MTGDYLVYPDIALLLRFRGDWIGQEVITDCRDIRSRSRKELNEFEAKSISTRLWNYVASNKDC